MSESEVLRRSFVPAAGKELILSDSATDVAGGFEQFAQVSGIPAEEILNEPMVTTPLPVCTYTDGVLKRPAAHPAFFWHPLMWLPERLALRLQVRETDDSIRIEDNSEWALRVALELQAAGLYDPTTGGWADVLALHDLDITDPAVVERVAAWLGGAADPVLDTIELMPEDPESPQWAFVEAHELVSTLQPAQWALTAQSLIEYLDRVDPAAPNLVEHLHLVSTLGDDMLGGLPDGDEFDVVFQAAPDMLGDSDFDPTYVGRRLREALVQIATLYNGALEALAHSQDPEPVAA